MDVEDGELTESGEEQDPETVKQSAQTGRSSKSKNSGLLRSGKSESTQKRMSDDPVDQSRLTEPVNDKRIMKTKKERKRHEDASVRAHSKSKRKAAEPPAPVEAASFEDELTAYQNTQRDRDQRNQREREQRDREQRDRVQWDRRSREPVDQHRPPVDGHRRSVEGHRGPPDGPRPPLEGRRSHSPGRRNRSHRDGPPPRQRSRKEEVRPKEKRVPCKFFLEGRCRHGDDCPFSHNVPQTKKLEACKFYVGGFCQKGPGCVYMHEEFPCKFFHTGQKCYSGDNCKFSHENLSSDAKLALERFLEKENKGAYDRNHRDRPVSPHHQEHEQPSPPGPHNISRGPLLPTPDGRMPGTEEYRRRRPEFFQETMPDENGRRGPPFERSPNFEDRPHEIMRPDLEYVSDMPVREGFPEQGHFQALGRDHFREEPHFRNDSSPPSSIHSDQNEPRMPKLFARLQHRAQLMKRPEHDNGQGLNHLDDDREDENGRLTINEPTSQEPTMPHPQSAGGPWTESDDEDDTGDQLLANSLKRLQERPDRRLTQWEQNNLYPPDHGYNVPPQPPYHHIPIELSPEELANRGKCLLPTPGHIEPEYFPTIIHNPPPYMPGHNQFVPPYQGPGHMVPPLAVPHNIHDPHKQFYEHHEYSEYPPQWQSHHPDVPYGPPPNEFPTDPYSGVQGPGFTASQNNPSGDRRQPPHGSGHEVAARSTPPGADYGPGVEPGEAGGQQTLEAVMQQLARKLGTGTAPRAPVEVVPEIDGALARNRDPPLYRLEAIHIQKGDTSGVLERLMTFRTAEELQKDPRVASMTQGLTPKDDKTSSATVMGQGKVEIIPAEPADSTDPKKAAQEFDAFTAMLNKALESTRKREQEEEAGRNSPGKRPRRQATTTQ